MRLLIAAIVGGIVMFVWQAVAHMALPLGEMGMKTASGQETAIAALQASATDGGGVYMLPGMSPEQWADEKARMAFQEQYKSSPYAFVVYKPEGNPALVDMVPNLIKQFVTDFIAAFVAAWVLALGAFGFGKRVLIAGALGLFAWLTISVPYWNWYLFPVDFTVGALLEQVIGWLLAGAAIAGWLGRGERGA
ncbi:hypothetical protein FCE95_02920 [Luteimonas gilva]|uniref:Uncharacterized protein n=1 Tax=Luteimonas gilva TaxID=2572684 RepID=A0A4U5JYF8_9GAMM|nr:hypothetical protein [Luteimonas gilva]TKR33277.1 hypothetical protein FCE95_02920 [Luteimonas gilva]